MAKESEMNTEKKDGAERPPVIIEFTDTEGRYGAVALSAFAEWFIHPDGTGRLVTKSRQYHFVRTVQEVELQLRRYARIGRDIEDELRDVGLRPFRSDATGDGTTE
jgi:hypothetical protein